MKFYRVCYSHEGGTSQDYGWFTSRREAAAAVAEFERRTKDEDGSACIEEPIEIVPTRAGILGVLNRYATYPDNG